MKGIQTICQSAAYHRVINPYLPDAQLKESKLLIKVCDNSLYMIQWTINISIHFQQLTWAAIVCNPWQSSQSPDETTTVVEPGAGSIRRRITYLQLQLHFNILHIDQHHHDHHSNHHDHHIHNGGWTGSEHLNISTFYISIIMIIIITPIIIIIICQMAIYLLNQEPAAS